MNTDTKEYSPKPYKPLTKWANEPSVEDLKTDLEEASSYQERVREDLKRWSLERDGGKPIKPNRPGKSVIRPKLIRKHNEWKYPALEEPFLSTLDMFDIRPRTAEDGPAAKQNSILINYQWSTAINKTKLIGDIVRTIVDEGTVIVKTGWETEYGIDVVEREQPTYASPEESYQLLQQKVEAGEMDPAEAQAMLEMGEPVETGTETVYVEVEKLVVNQPTYEVCSTANVTIDPACEGIIENAKFAIHEYDVSMSTLVKDRYVPGDKAKGIPASGFYYNLDNIKTEDDSTGQFDEFKSEEVRSFKYNDAARKQLRAYEYWGYWDIDGNGELTAIVATWVNGTMIRMEKNPFPHNRLPFSVTTYMPVKRELHGEPDGELLIEHQESIGKMTRAIHDITANQAVGQTFIDEQMFPTPSQKANYEKGNTVYYRSGFNPKQSIHKNTVEPIPASAFQLIQSQTQDAEAVTGTRPFAGQGSGMLGATATGIRSSADATAKRELSVLRRLSNILFRDIAKLTIAMNQAFLEEEFVVRITAEEFVTIRRDDLLGNFDMVIDVSTPERDNETAEKIMKLMQTNAANMDPKLAAMHYVKLADLWNLPDLAEAIKSYEPQPDPKRQELMDIQIENAKLENERLKKIIEESDSKILERLSRAHENEIDQRKKAAEASFKEAQTAKLQSETDMLDFEFTRKFDGNDRLEQIEDQEFKAATATKQAEDTRLAQMALQNTQKDV